MPLPTSTTKPLMSTLLSWRKVHPPKELGYRLKFYISEQLWGHDGSLNGDWATVSKDTLDLSYLRGVRDETQDKDLKKEIETLLDLISKHGEIEVSLGG